MFIFSMHPHNFSVQISGAEITLALYGWEPWTYCQSQRPTQPQCCSVDGSAIKGPCTSRGGNKGHTHGKNLSHTHGYREGVKLSHLGMNQKILICAPMLITSESRKVTWLLGTLFFIHNTRQQLASKRCSEVHIKCMQIGFRKNKVLYKYMTLKGKKEWKDEEKC